MRKVVMGVALVLGCTGRVGVPGSGSTTASSGSTAPGATSSAPSGPGTSAPPGPTGSTAFIDEDSPALERLTNVEYSQTVADVLGEPADAATRYSFPADPTQHGFDDNVGVMQGRVVANRRDAAQCRFDRAGVRAPCGDRRLFLVKLDQSTGALSIDTDFHDANGQPGFDFVDQQWPHGWKGTAIPHGAVFSR